MDPKEGILISREKMDLSRKKYSSTLASSYLILKLIIEKIVQESHSINFYVEITDNLRGKRTLISHQKLGLTDTTFISFMTLGSVVMLTFFIEST